MVRHGRTGAEYLLGRALVVAVSLSLRELEGNAIVESVCDVTRSRPAVTTVNHRNRHHHRHRYCFLVSERVAPSFPFLASLSLPLRRNCRHQGAQTSPDALYFSYKNTTKIM